MRALLNVLVLALLGAAFYGIYWATEYTLTLQVQRVLEEEEGPWVLELTFPQVKKPCGSELGCRIPGILGSFKTRRGYRWAFSSLLSLSGDAPCPTDPTIQASGGLSTIHLHFSVQLCAASCVQVHCLTRGLHSKPTDRLDPA
jgi:hypothetical protein